MSALVEALTKATETMRERLELGIENDPNIRLAKLARSALENRIGILTEFSNNKLPHYAKDIVRGDNLNTLISNIPMLADESTFEDMSVLKEFLGMYMEMILQGWLEYSRNNWYWGNYIDMFKSSASINVMDLRSK